MKLASVVLGALLGVLATQGGDRPGYRDTPILPGTQWHVHDPDRPYPPVVTPPQGEAPPSDAVVLFDGTNLDAWEGDGGEARWKLVDGAMEVNGTGSIRTRASFGDCQLHLEWRTPTPVDPSARGQARGNSGVFLMGLYEVQVLDSFDNPTYADGQAGALYGQRPPAVNACRPPGEWQSYDILFRAPRFEGDRLVSPARITVLQNGICIHDGVEFLGPTRHRALAHEEPHPSSGPLKLQDHGNPVRYRNIWIRP